MFTIMTRGKFKKRRERKEMTENTNNNIERPRNKTVTATDKKQVKIMISPETANKIKYVTKAKNITQSTYIENLIIKDYNANKASYEQAIKEKAQKAQIKAELEKVLAETKKKLKDLKSEDK